MGRMLLRALPAIILSASFAGCTSGNSAVQPPYQSKSVSQSGKLQFAVGTATIETLTASGSTPGFIGLNTVVTFRQAGGESATAVNTPVITGPPAFVVPNSVQAFHDAGTNHISANAQGTSNVTTTFGTIGQATLYGFGPNNYNISGSAPFGNYAVPFYNDLLPPASSSGSYPSTTFYGAPPAFPTTSIAGFPGYNLGFVDFAATPVSGTYSLAVNVPVASGLSQGAANYNASANLNAARVLPVFTGIAFTGNSSGGGALKVSLPAGSTEAYVQLNDLVTGALFGFAFHASGTQTLGAGSLSPCDFFAVIGAAFDYPAIEAAAPKNTDWTPKIVGAAGQDDVSVSLPAGGQMPPPSAGGKCSAPRTRGFHR